MPFPKGHKLSEETKRKIGLANSIALKGRKLSSQEIAARKGRIPWNKGKTGIYSLATLEKMRINRLGRIPWNKGLINRKINFCVDCGKRLTGHHNPQRCNSCAKKKSLNPQWNNGSSFEPYPVTFNQQLRDRIRVRDNFKCQLCGVPELECKTRLHIHHIDYNKGNCNMNNLLSLCSNCHSKTNIKRNFWRIYFQKTIMNGV